MEKIRRIKIYHAHEKKRARNVKWLVAKNELKIKRLIKSI